ncbi:hypothetical protein CGRA01v4_08139 [Colletotrichum graminicola]|nr:hypothetical protein CGRA01v4_08139 [Colletotrichum graminicola]
MERGAKTSRSAAANMDRQRAYTGVAPTSDTVM